MKEINSGGLVYLKSELIKTPHLFTTRHGGVSEGPFESLNLSFVVGDERERVMENMHRVAGELGFSEQDVVCSRQAHTTTVRRVGAAQRGTGVTKERFTEPADALITDEEDLLLLVRCADCTPILLWDGEHRAVAAVHSGWRGTLSNVLQSTVCEMEKEFGTRPEVLAAAVGSCISVCCFEVGEELAVEFDKAGYGEFIDRSFEKPHVDLKGICLSQLVKLGVRPHCIDVSDECTKCMSHKYFSHRAQGDKRGLLAAVIGIKSINKV